MRKRLTCLAVVAGAVVPAFGGSLFVNLGSADSFGLLGGTISNTGTSVVTGNVGATTTITGFPSGTATGTVYPAPSDPTVAAAYTDFVNGFNAAQLLSSTQSFTDLSTSETFIGNNVYTFTDSTISTTTGINLTFDAQNDSSEVFVIRVADALTVNGTMTFTLENGAQADNIFWIVGTAAVISVGSSAPVIFDGNILAGSTFTMTAAAGGASLLSGTVNGCVFAENANTLSGTTDIGGCSNTEGGNGGGGGVAPEPGTPSLLCMGLGAGFLLLRKFRRIG